MIKNCLSILFLSLIVLLISCNNSSEPTNSDKYEISGEPFAVELNTNPDSLQIEHSPLYLIDYSSLKLNGIMLTPVKYYYPSPKWDIGVDREFILAVNDSFIVEIKNCCGEYAWSIDLGNIEFSENDNWINSEVALIRTEKNIESNGNVSYRFVFQTKREGKGYICFIEKDSLGTVSSNKSHGILIGYTTKALEKILLNINEIKWGYNTEEGKFSTVSCKNKRYNKCI